MPKATCSRPQDGRASSTRNTSGTVLLLKPETSYTFTVTARDFGGNVSPLSDPLVVTTEPGDPNDVTPPTTPTGLYEIHWGDNEMEVNWTQSTDSVTEQRFIQYNVYVDGVLEDITVGSSRSIAYAPGTSNIVHISVEAIDEAGNVSARASITADLHQP